MAIAVGTRRQQQQQHVPVLPDTAESSTAAAAAAALSSSSSSSSSLKQRFLQLLEANPAGIANSELKTQFGETGEYPQLVPIINELTAASRLVMSKSTSATGRQQHELFYTLVSTDMAAKFQGLDASAKMVYQVIEKAGNQGCWTKDIRLQTSIQQNALSKLLKTLETRRLIKPVKSVTAKSKKLYMLAELQPSKELTGGVWYSDLEFDHEFINELRHFLLHCIRRLAYTTRSSGNGNNSSVGSSNNGVSLQELHQRMVQARVSRVELSLTELQQLLQTLVYDYMVEEVVVVTGDDDDDIGGGGGGGGTITAAAAESILYVPARRISVPCEFKWWEVLEPDFHFRAIEFEDGVTLPPHEPHHHTS